MGDQKNRLVFFYDPQKVQNRGRIEFLILVGDGIVTQNVIKYILS